MSVPQSAAVYERYDTNGHQEPAWIISLQPMNESAGHALREAEASGTTQSLSDTVLRKHFRAIEKRKNRGAEANG